MRLFAVRLLAEVWVMDVAPEEERRNPGYGRGLVWLVGMDGNDVTEDRPAERAVQERVLARRRQPVGIPESDRAPRDVGSPYTNGTKRR